MQPDAHTDRHCMGITALIAWVLILRSDNEDPEIYKDAGFLGASFWKVLDAVSMWRLTMGWAISTTVYSSAFLMCAFLQFPSAGCHYHQWVFSAGPPCNRTVGSVAFGTVVLPMLNVMWPPRTSTAGASTRGHFQVKYVKKSHSGRCGLLRLCLDWRGDLFWLVSVFLRRDIKLWHVC